MNERKANAMSETIEAIEESPFVAWAEEELRRAGLFDQDSDYGGMMGESVMKLIRAFSDEGHSGFSAGMAASIFGRLSAWKPLTPLTAEPDEWQDMSDYGDGPMMQSRRSPSCFSNDGLRTYYDIDAPLSRWRRAAWRLTRALGLRRRWEKRVALPKVS